MSNGQKVQYIYIYHAFSAVGSLSSRKELSNSIHVIPRRVCVRRTVLQLTAHIRILAVSAVADRWVNHPIIPSHISFPDIIPAFHYSYHRALGSFSTTRYDTRADVLLTPDSLDFGFFRCQRPNVKTYLSPFPRLV